MYLCITFKLRGDFMSKIYKNVTELIGKTPLIELTKFEEIQKLEAKVIAKVEFFNPKILAFRITTGVAFFASFFICKRCASAFGADII